VVAALACGVETESPSGADVDVDPTWAESEPAVPSMDSRLTGELALPDDFPRDVPTYPEASLTWVNLDENGSLASFSTADDPSEVAEYLSREFASQGWMTETSQQPVGRTILAIKGSREATVLITGEGDTTQIEVILMPRG
jgi:hypothetical protein